jgi:hypothetical protein
MTKNCSKWERSSAVFACRTLVITSRIASSSSQMSATSISPLRRNYQTSRLNLNCCGWFEIIPMMHKIRA